MQNKRNKPGQGRPVTLTARKMYSLRLPIEMMDRIEGNKTQFVIDAVTDTLDRNCCIASMILLNSQELGGNYIEIERKL